MKQPAYGYIPDGKGGVKQVPRAQFKRFIAKRRREAAKHPGYRWRVNINGRPNKKGWGNAITFSSLDHPDTQFDELVIDHWLHLEGLDDRSWFLSLGDWRLWVHITKTGELKITMDEERPKLPGSGLYTRDDMRDELPKARTLDEAKRLLKKRK